VGEPLLRLKNRNQMFLFIYLFCLLKAGGAEATFFAAR
jgi:hypothetical protein